MLVDKSEYAVMSQSNYHAYCCAWVICFDVHTMYFDYEMANDAVRSGIVFG